jgi:hypothetical protein
MSTSTAPVLTHTDTAVRDEVAAATPANAGSRNPAPGDKYTAEVNNLLDAYEKKQTRLAEERAKQAPPEEQGLHEGESWDSIYSSQPPEVQRAMAEMRKMMTKKTQELAAERKKLEAQNKAFLDSGLLDQLRRDAGSAPEEFDPFNPDHVAAAIEAKVAKRLADVLEPLNHQHQRQEQVSRYESFKSEHPDLLTDPEIKSSVAAMLQADKNLSLEAAYWAAKGKTLSAKQKVQDDRRDLERRAARRAALISDKGVRPGTPVINSPELKNMSAIDIYNTLKAAKG